MNLQFLGTGAGVPAKSRNVSALVLQLLEERGKEWLFDCGEATQHQILRAPVKLHRIEHIFISHLHGDHIFGLPGLLGSRAFQGAESPLTVFGPEGIQEFIETSLRQSQTHLTYPLTVNEIRPGILIDDGQFRVECDQLNHVIPSYGFRIVEKDRPGRLRADLLKAQNIAPGPVYGQIKAGGRVTLPDGRVIESEQFLSPPIPGRTLAIFGDTAPCEAGLRLAQNADVLVHEATFHSDEAAGAHTYGHSTAKDAALLAKRANVKTLILTHISARYENQGSRLLQEAKAIHEDTYLAEDFWSFPVQRP
jgi:ribonuclease Z